MKYVMEFKENKNSLRFVAPNDTDAKAYAKLHCERKNLNIISLYEDNDPELRMIEEAPKRKKRK